MASAGMDAPETNATTSTTTTTTTSDEDDLGYGSAKRASRPLALVTLKRLLWALRNFRRSI